ncbi:hypothetical protein J4407_01745 [Candidatus Pacearchaeota archaeon]|nr:hypothetical protein [Candidatus Pacearchaeota archaeon]
MATEALTQTTESLIEGYNIFLSTFPTFLQQFINLFLIVFIVVVYFVLVWKFHNFIATKNVINLNLNQYNQVEHPSLAKFLAGSLYLVEYIIILPFVIFFWFSVFTFFLVLFTEDLSIGTTLIVSATLVSSIRMIAYYREGLAKELAKLLPFTILAISFLNPNFFHVERLVGQLIQIPDFFSQILIYFVFIIILETILRFFDFLFSFFGMEEPVQEEYGEE